MTAPRRNIWTAQDGGLAGMLGKADTEETGRIRAREAEQSPHLSSERLRWLANRCVRCIPLTQRFAEPP
jgi:hypothetical protein